MLSAVIGGSPAATKQHLVFEEALGVTLFEDAASVTQGGFRRGIKLNRMLAKAGPGLVVTGPRYDTVVRGWLLGLAVVQHSSRPDCAD